MSNNHNINPENVYKNPPNILDFVSIEHQQFITTLANFTEEMELVSQAQGLYSAAMSNQNISANRVIIFQFLTFIHYHFLFSTSCYMRCHMAEGFSSARAAIDAALTAAHIIKNPDAQKAYIEGTKPFDKLIRHYKNLIRDKKELPHPHIQYLVEMFDFCSKFASHADMATFIHRLDFIESPDTLMTVGYFQFPRDPAEMRHHFLGLLHIFIVALDIFSNFIVDELKALPPEWRSEIHSVGSRIENLQHILKPTEEPKP